MRNLEYNIGLDIGTDSVGWAVTDLNNDVIKYNNLKVGKSTKHQRMWGSLLFDAGETAKQRRIFRSARRRKARMHERINILEHIFEKEINKVDPVFFRRLEESNLYLEDRKYATDKLGIFSDDKLYSQTYPTIYHLRNKLCISNEKMDIRLVYLAIHHIIKYRGNFLYENQKFNLKDINLQNQFNEIFNFVNEKNYVFNMNEVVDYNKIKSYVVDNKLGNKERMEKIIGELSYDSSNKDIVKNIVLLLVGLQGDFTKIITVNDLDEDNKKTLSKIKFSDKNYIDNESDILSLLGDDSILLEKIKDLYTSMFLLRLFGEVENPSISKIMIDRYKKHKEDLKKFKAAVLENDRKNNTNKYDEFFRNHDISKKNYETYIRNTSKYNYDDLKKDMKVLIQNTKYEAEILKDINNDNFLKKLNVVDNSLFPYQLNMDELDKIINNQKEYYPFLADTLDDNEYKLDRLLEFRVPYYVGPIASDKAMKDHKYAWFERKNGTQNERITPFNFYDVVDINKSAENFITNMTNFCTYLPDEKVMPKNSLLYSKFMVLNELKQIKINDKKLSYDVQINIYNNLFKCNGGKKVTNKSFISWLNNNGYNIDGNAKITGYQSEDGFTSSLKSYNDFNKILGNLDDYKTKEMVERIIEWITIYEDKKILKDRLENEYGNFLSSDQIKKMLTLNYSGWSSISKKLLECDEIGYVDESTGEWLNIMSLLEKTNENFMQIINNSKYKIQEQIKNVVYKGEKEDITHDDIDALACSPAVKKGIWQSVLLVKEIISLMNNKKPNHIFLEFARNEGKKERTTTRSNYIKKLYDKIKNDVNEYNSNNKNVLSDLKKYDVIDSEKLLLYFLQQGKSLYSGKKLDILSLNDYEVDHIIPRSLIKDDSIDNKALVLKIENQRKSDGTLDIRYQSENKDWWYYLLNHNFISSKKYRSLTTKEFSSEVIDGFINRQLVETRQIVKNLSNLLNQFLGDDCVCAVRANLSHNFREKYGMYKYRDLNNLHHAHDAYLASSLGNYLLKVNPSIQKDIIYSKHNYRYDKTQENNKKYNYGWFLSNMDDTIANNIKNTLYYSDPIVTRKTEIKTGEFYKQTIYSNETSGNIIPVKSNLDPKKYGGFTSEQKGYLMLIEFDNRGTRKRKVISVPVRYNNYNDNQIIDLLVNKMGYVNPTIIKNMIGKNQLLYFKGQRFYMSSDTELVNAVEFHFTKQEQDEYRTLLNYIFNNKTPKDKDGNILSNDIDKIDDLINVALNKMHDYYPAYNSEYEKIINSIKEINMNKLDDKIKINLFKQLIIIMKSSAMNGNLKFMNDLQSSYKFDDRVGRKYKQLVTSGKLIFTSLTGLKTNEILIGEE